MDKTQRQLIKTYFRKRKIAANHEEMDDYAEYTGYELDFGIRNNIINPNDIEPYHIIKALETNSKLIDYFKDRLDELDGGSISDLLSSQPQFINFYG